MDNAAAIGIYLIDRLGYKEYVFPYTPNYEHVKDENYEYFEKLFEEQ